LIGDSSHHQFPHQAGPIRNQHADSLHIVSPTLNVSAEYRCDGSSSQASKAI
jgi:hypothetical protein